MTNKFEKAAGSALEQALSNVDDELKAEQAPPPALKFTPPPAPQEQSKYAPPPISGRPTNDTVTVTVPVGYDKLHSILRLAFEQSATGKGKERHATGPTGFKPWLEQPINSIGRMVGPGYSAGQVQKKVQEAVTMAGNGNVEAAKAEALGAIVYAAALYHFFNEMGK